VTLTSIAVLNMLNVEWQKRIFLKTFFIDFGIMVLKGRDGPTITQVSKRKQA
jgi:hypothetical protein